MTPPHFRYDLSIPGWMEENELQWLAATADLMDSIVEIGCYQGRSTFALAANCRGPVYAVDTWQDIMSDGADNLQAFLRNLNGRLTLAEFIRVHPWKMHSQDAAAYIPAVEMVFVDGDHTLPGVKTDLQLWTRKARKLICGHDYGNPQWPGVKQAVDQFFGKQVENPTGSIWLVTLPKLP